MRASRIQVYQIETTWRVSCPRCLLMWWYPAGGSETAISDAQHHGVTWHPRKAA